MPYIPAERRDAIQPMLVPLLQSVPLLSEGEMNYVFTMLVWAHMTHGGELKPTYADFEAAIGLLECVKLELYRRAVAPYEDAKCAQNGEVPS